MFYFEWFNLASIIFCLYANYYYFSSIDLYKNGFEVAAALALKEEIGCPGKCSFANTL